MTEKFKLKRGGELEIKLVSSFRIAKMRDTTRLKYIAEHFEGEEPEPPTFTSKYGGGTLPTGAPLPEWEETHTYTAETIDDGGPADKKAWAEYIRLTAEIDDAVRQEVNKVYFHRGVVSDPPDSDRWIKEQQEDGIEVPNKSDERAFKQHWLETEMLTDMEEARWLLWAIQGQSVLVREAQQVAASMFQR